MWWVLPLFWFLVLSCSKRLYLCQCLSEAPASRLYRSIKVLSLKNVFSVSISVTFLSVGNWCSLLDYFFPPELSATHSHSHTIPCCLCLRGSQHVQPTLRDWMRELDGPLVCICSTWLSLVERTSSYPLTLHGPLFFLQLLLKFDNFLLNLLSEASKTLDLNLQALKPDPFSLTSPTLTSVSMTLGYRTFFL